MIKGIEDPTKFKIKSFKIIQEFLIEIQFKDGKVQKIDFSKLNFTNRWEELNNLDYFNQIRINEVHNLSWPHGQDLNPQHLYYWEEYEQYYLPKE